MRAHVLCFTLSGEAASENQAIYPDDLMCEPIDCNAGSGLPLVKNQVACCPIGKISCNKFIEQMILGTLLNSQSPRDKLFDQALTICLISMQRYCGILPKK